MKASGGAGTDIALTAPAQIAPPHKRFLPWLGLFAILILYACCVARLEPTNFFGLTEDDSIYFTSARALAQGHGYVLPSVPGTPPATKYPVLYAWLLSWVWRWNPSFPSNVLEAVALNVAFGFGFLAAAFLFLRRLGRLGDWEALFLTAFCALHPVVLFHTANLVAEMPFAALSLGAIVLAGRAVRGENEIPSCVASGILSGLSILVRVLGAPIAAGLFLAILWRKGWRRAAFFASGTVPFVAAWLWRAIVEAPPAAPTSASSCSSAWQTIWLYYTSYLGFWKADVLANHAIWHVLKENLLLLVLQPGIYLVEPRFMRPAVLAFAPVVVLSAGAILGLLVRGGDTKWQPVHYALALYLLPVLLWDYPAVERFLIPFLPLFVGGLWLAGKPLLEQVEKSLRSRDPKNERVAAVFLGVAAVCLVLSIGWSFWQGFAFVRHRSELRAEMLRDKREAYSWLRADTPSSSRVIAYEDASLYLYSERQAMRPLIFSPAGSFRPELLRSELACILEGARTIGADYWVMADDDFGFEWEPATTAGRRQEKQLEAALQQVFRSTHGYVRVYRLGSPLPADETACEPSYLSPQGSQRVGHESRTKSVTKLSARTGGNVLNE